MIQVHLWTLPTYHCVLNHFVTVFYFTSGASNPSRPCVVDAVENGAIFGSWLNSFFVYSFVSVWGCGCLCIVCLCVCLLWVGQLSDLDLRAPSVAFNTTSPICRAKCSHELLPLALPVPTMRPRPILNPSNQNYNYWQAKGIIWIFIIT